MDKPKQTNTQVNLLPDLPNYNPEPADGVRVGESPVPGLTLRRILRGHTSYITHIAWSPDGRFLASPSRDKTIRIWDVARGECTAVLEGHTSTVYSVAWSPDGRKMASSSEDKTVRIWDTETWEILAMLEEHKLEVGAVAWSPDGHRLASCSGDGTICIWNVETLETQKLISHTALVWSVEWSPSGSLLASGSYDDTITLWNMGTGEVFRTLTGHEKDVYGITWSRNGQWVASASEDRTIRIWNGQTGKEIAILEGHNNDVTFVSFSFNDTVLASKAQDDTIRFWHCGTWEELAKLEEVVSGAFSAVGLAFHPSLPLLTTLGEKDTVIRIWELDMDVLLGQSVADSVRYTTAKLVLVGDSGVGKTGLGWRLAHGEFKEHASTHGQQFWVIDELSQTRADGTECEAVLWDLAGQHVYRPIHAIFLDDVDASLVLFDPTNRQDPLKGAEFWLEHLACKKQLPPSVLVGARLDRGAAVLSQEDLAQFCQQRGISGGYLGTSAKEGLGLDALLETLKKQIPWDQMTTTVTTRTFKKVKDYVLSLKEKPDRKGMLVSPAALRCQLQTSDPAWEFSDAEMMTAVGHLGTHGYVAILHSSSGDEYILLAPELLVDLASSIVLQADKHPRELGALNESDLLAGRYPLSELNNLETDEAQILLDAAVTRFLAYNICFRETLGNDTLLIFPGLIKQKRPLWDEVEALDDISYIVRGRVENIYPALVVLLGFTRTFTRVNQWQRQAQYEMGAGNICGFRLIEDVEGEIELILYYSVTMPNYGRSQFQGLFEEFLYQQDVEVTPFPPVLCSNGHLQERSAVINRRREGKTFIFCAACGQQINLPDIEKQAPANASEADWIQQEEALARLRSAYETHLTRIKAFRRDRAAPRCYLSHLPAQAEWANRLTEDLRDAGVHVLANRDDLTDDDFILIADTPSYQQAFKGNTSPIAADAALIRRRLAQGKKSTIFHLLVESEQEISSLNNIRPGDFRQETHYAVSLFDLVLMLYVIPLSHSGFSPLREDLKRKWAEAFSSSGVAVFEEPREETDVVGTVINVHNYIEQRPISTEENNVTKKQKPKNNAWINGSFYLVVFIMVMTTFAVISSNVSAIALPVVIIGGLLAIGIIGAFQLRNDDSLTEKNFLTLILETYKRLPLLRGNKQKETDTK